MKNNQTQRPMHTVETFQSESEDGKTVHNTFNVYGGSVIFAATAPHVTQHIYGNHISTLPTVSPEEAEEVSRLTKEELKLFRYIPNVASLHEFIAQIELCDSAHDVALLAWRRLDNVFITRENIVTAEFIESLHPFIRQIKTGTSTDNLRCHINKFMVEKKA